MNELKNELDIAWNNYSYAESKAEIDYWNARINLINSQISEYFKSIKSK